jgi:transposase
LEMRSRAVLAVERGQPVGRVAEAYDINRTTLFRWLRRFTSEGNRGLERRVGSGRPRLLTALDMEAVNDIVLEPASVFGFETDLWTVGRLRRVIREQYGVAVSSDTVWRRLREAGFTYQKPERRYFEVNEEAREEWLRVEVPRIRADVRRFRAILYFQDESNVSLTAFLGKTWAFRGQTPAVCVTGKRGGVTVMSALSGQGRLLFRLFSQRIASAEVISAAD